MNEKAKCKLCGREINFWINFLSGYCGECANRTVEAKQLLKENGFGTIENLNCLYPHDTPYSELFLKKSQMISFPDGKSVYVGLIKDLIATNNNQAVLRKFCEDIVIELEKSKIETRQKQLDLKHRAEKEYFGSEKTKRITFTNDEKEDILNSFNNKCVICDTEEGLHIHHKDNNPKNNQMDNLIVLCGVCHKKVYMKVR